MVYLPGIPQPGDSPATDSQAQILENFTQIGAQFGTSAAADHVALDAVADNGMHQRVTINDVRADPGQAFPITSIYTKHVGAGPDRYTNLYFEADPENVVNASQFPLNAIKAWCTFDGTAAGPIAITDGFNVTDVTDNSTGNYTINFTNNLQNANYAAIVTGGNNTSGMVTGKAVDTCSINIRAVNSGALVDTNNVNVVIIGN